MTIDTYDNVDNLLMNGEIFGCLSQNNQANSDEKYETPNIEIDLKSGCIVLPFPYTDKPQCKNLKFKLNPIMCESLAFNDLESGNGKLFPVLIPYVDNSKQFSQYVSKLFEIYQDLGSHRQFSISTIGLINHSSPLEHAQTVNLAMDAICSELELFIESIKYTNQYQRLSDLEDCLTILNCLKTHYFIIDSQENDSRMNFLKSLINWINRSDGDPDEIFIAKIFNQKDIKVYESSFFWKLITQLVLRGLFDQAIESLKQSEIFPYLQATCEKTFNLVSDLVILIDSYSFESESIFRDWKDTMLNLLENFNNFSVDSKISDNLKHYLLDFLLVLTGNQNKIIISSKTWYEAYCGLMLYYIPSLELSQEYLDMSLKSHSLNIVNSWEQPCLNIIRGKIYSILPSLESMDLCTSGFAAAICEAKGLLENEFLEEFTKDTKDHFYDEKDEDDIFCSKGSMATYLLNQLALWICSYKDKSLWPVSIGILALVPNVNYGAKRLAISELLLHFPYETNDDIEWILSICAKWRLPKVARTLYKNIGQEALYHNNVIEAMSNFSKAGEIEWVKHYSWMIFEASVLQGKPLEDMVVNTIVSNENIEIPKELIDSMITNIMKQALSPYAVLYQFYELLNDENWDKALKHLISLLEFSYLPQQYFMLLVGKFLYPIFLKNDKIKIDEDYLIRIMECLESLEDLQPLTLSMYDELLKRHDIIRLPSKPLELINLARNRLNFKLCQEFM